MAASDLLSLAELPFSEKKSSSSTSKNSTLTIPLPPEKPPNGANLDSKSVENHPSPKKPAPSEYESNDKPRTLGAAAKNGQAPADAGLGQELRNLAPKEIQASPVLHPVETSSVSHDISLSPPTLPERITIGSNDADTYGLTEYGDGAGLYYCSTITPDLSLHQEYIRKPTERLSLDLNNYIQEQCVKPKVQRRMQRLRIGMSGVAFAIETRLSGRPRGNSEEVELTLAMWVFCVSTFTEELVRKALAKPNMLWASEETIEVVTGLRWNKRSEYIADLDLSKGFQFRDSYKLHLHTEEAGEDKSAVGLFVCATLTKNGSIIDQCVSRLGGLLSLREETTAISTAHGILDMLISAGLYCIRDEDTDSLENTPDSDTESEAESDGTAGTSHEDESKSVVSIESPGSSAVNRVTRWNVISEAVIFDFIWPILSDPDKYWVFGANTRPHDFALFKLGPYLSERLNNSYEYESVQYVVTKEHTSSPAESEMVLILLGHNTFARGKVLPGASAIYLSGMKFNTKRVLLDSSLGMSC
ncbi:hypothetical protein NUW58_g5427 [Xylaria curta]|uniref:Uncharacterized protein n=1 Tax=Xylaria curta TaxID=42375 RepID=A0ACC1P4C1_9PEZI|nr:hypothetical protein NUW58_g5427 [Xylaria curta]